MEKNKNEPETSYPQMDELTSMISTFKRITCNRVKICGHGHDINVTMGIRKDEDVDIGRTLGPHGINKLRNGKG